MIIFWSIGDHCWKSSFLVPDQSSGTQNNELGQAEKMGEKKIQNFFFKGPQFSSQNGPFFNFWHCNRVLRDHFFCSRPRPRLVLISILFQDQYQDKSWNETFFETNTKRCLDFSFLSRPIPRLVLILETIRDQYQESWLWTCSRPIPRPIPRS